jgi:hypothetical protein
LFSLKKKTNACFSSKNKIVTNCFANQCFSS